MKKIYISVIVASLVLGLSACSKNEESPNIITEQVNNDIQDFDVGNPEYIENNEVIVNEDVEEIIVPENSDIIEAGDYYSMWNYSVIQDGIRGNRKIAKIFSENSHDVGNGPTPLKMMVRQKEPGKDYYEIMLEADGIFYCTSNPCKVTVRFDDTVMPYYYSNEVTGKLNIIFIQAHGHFYQSLKNAKEVVIEAPFLNFGNKQFYFNNEGFDIESF